MIRQRLAAFVRDRTLIFLGLAAIVVMTTLRLVAISDSLVVYCAHDSIFADQVIAEFQRRTGHRVVVKYDLEATKSLGLVEMLLREKEHPRCDVFWNNEMLGTMALAEQGVLEPYRGPGWERIPAQWKDPDGLWTGFAGRLRVIAYRPGAGISADRAARWLEQEEADFHRFAMAKPLYGTTLTHYAVLWKTKGADGLQRWHQRARQRGLQEVNGNARVKDLVAAGNCDAGATDTDDYFSAKDEKAPLEMVPATLPDGSAICIPNTVAIVKGTTRQDAAREFVDYLLSQETELALARSKARQIPLGPIENFSLPGDVQALLPIAQRAVPLREFFAARRDCLAWLKTVYAD